MWTNWIEGTGVIYQDEETGGEGDAAGGSLIGSAGTETDSGAEGTEGQPDGGDAGNANAADDTEGDANAAAAGEGDNEGEGEGDGKPEGAPEAYEAFQIPEGYDATEEALNTFTEFAKANNMSQESAQKALDYYSGEVKKLFAEQDSAWQDVRKEWVNTAQTDKEFGGTNFKENMKHVAAATERFGTPELREALNSSGMGDHPELVRFFYRVGKLAGEGEFLTGEGDTSGEVDAANVLYPGMK